MTKERECSIRHGTGVKIPALLFIIAMMFAMMFTMMPMEVHAASGEEVNYLKASWNSESKTVTYTDANATAIVLADSATNWGDGKTYVVPEAGLTISSRITVNGTVNLILRDGATLTASQGINVASENTLNIYAQSEGDAAGSLIATGSENYAGIGGGIGESNGTVNIHGGTVTATGGYGSAGIGGGTGGDGNGGAGGTVTIYGGTVTATGGIDAGAGIGGGKAEEGEDVSGGNGGKVTIYGGTVTATGVGNGVGIGGGDCGGSSNTGGDGAEVTINGGTVKATGGEFAGAGIGGGYSAMGDPGAGGTVTINGGTVTATGGSFDETGAVGIGGGHSDQKKGGAGGTVTINGGTVTATGGHRAAGIGGGSSNNDDGGAGGTVTINGGKVTATGGSYEGTGAVGIGGGHSDNNKGGDGAEVTIKGGTVTTTGGDGAVGIGGGTGEEAGANNTLTVGEGLKVYGDDEVNPPTSEKASSAYADTRWRYMIVKAPPTPVPYVYYTAEGNKATKNTDGSCADYTEVTSSTKAWEDGKWYVVNDTVSISERITVTGTVNLILCDGKTLTASKGITVSGDNKLNIYAQVEGTGVLNSGTIVEGVSSIETGFAGIGGANTEETKNAGSITIHGGKIAANGGDYGAGIGAGYVNFQSIGTFSELMVYDGTVIANGGKGAAGIGGCYGGTGGKVNISGNAIVEANGGTITVFTSEGGAAGIGGGSGGAGGTVTISGNATVTTTGGKGAVGIGSGKGATDYGSLTVTDGLEVRGGDDESSAIVRNDYNTNRYTYMKVQEASHTHSFTYSVKGAVITATCSAEDCPLPPSAEGEEDHVATLTISAPTTSSGEAVLTQEPEGAFGSLPAVKYQSKSGTDWSEETETPPTADGFHKASITLGEGDGAVTATVTYGMNCITYDNATNGSVSGATGATVGATVEPEITPDTGYEIDTLTVKKADNTKVTVTDNKSFVMPEENVTVSATFKKTDYAITKSAENGTLTVKKGEAEVTTANYNDTITLSATPNAGYELSSLTVKKADNTEVSVTDNSFTMPAGAVTVSASFTAIDYTVTIASGIANGTVTASKTEKVHIGDEITLSATPNTGCHLVSLAYKAGDGDPVSISDSKFTMPAANVTVNAVFKETEYTLTVSEDRATLTATADSPAATKYTASVTLNNMTDGKKVYDGESVSASVSKSEGFPDDKVTVSSVKYKGQGSTSYTESTTGPTVPGTYRASVTVSASKDGTEDSKTIYKDFEITKASVGTPAVTMSDYTYEGTVPTPGIGSFDGGGSVSYYYNTSNSTEGGTLWSSSITGTSLNAGTYYLYAVVAETDNYQGYTTATKQFTVSKATQTKPGKPVVQSKSSKTIYLKAVSGCEYRCGDGAWQSSTTFGGLKAGEVYLFSQRKKGDANHEASEASEGIEVRTNNKKFKYVVGYNKISHGSWGWTNEPVYEYISDYVLAPRVSIDTLWLVDGDTLIVDGNCYLLGALVYTGKFKIISLNGGNLYTYGGVWHYGSELTFTKGVEIEEQPSDVTEDAMQNGGLIVNGTKSVDLSEIPEDLRSEIDASRIVDGKVQVELNNVPEGVDVSTVDQSAAMGGKINMVAGNLSVSAADGMKMFEDSAELTVSSAVALKAVDEDNQTVILDKDSYTGKELNQYKSLSVMPTSMVTEAPTAKELTYNGSEQELVKAGTAENGTLQYALGSKSKAEESFSTDIPKGKDAGTYYVWYKVVGDENYSDTVAECVTVTISEVDKSALNTAIEEAEALYDTIKDRTKYSSFAGTLQTAITNAKSLAEDANVTEDEVADAAAAIKEATEAAKAEMKKIDDAEAADSDAVKNVADMIDALPASDKIATADKSAIEAARAAYNALTEEQKAKVSADTLKKLTDAEAALAAAVKAEAASKTVKNGDVIIVNKNTYTITSVEKGTVKFTKAKNAKKVTIPATVTYNGKKYAVTGIAAKAFKGKKTKTIVIKTKKLTKKSVKKSLKGSKVKKIKVKVGKKKVNRKYVKKYKKIFKKKNSGKKVTVK